MALGAMVKQHLARDVVLTVLSVVLGAVIGAAVSWWFARDSSKELQKTAGQLKQVTMEVQTNLVIETRRLLDVTRQVKEQGDSLLAETAKAHDRGELLLRETARVRGQGQRLLRETSALHEQAVALMKETEKTRNVLLVVSRAFENGQPPFRFNKDATGAPTGNVYDENVKEPVEAGDGVHLEPAADAPRPSQ